MTSFLADVLLTGPKKKEFRFKPNLPRNINNLQKGFTGIISENWKNEVQGKNIQILSSEQVLAGISSLGSKKSESGVPPASAKPPLNLQVSPSGDQKSKTPSSECFNWD